MAKRLWYLRHNSGFPEDFPATRTYELTRLLAARGWDVTVLSSGFNHITRKDRWEHDRNGECVVVREGVRWVFLKTASYKKNDLRRLANLVGYARKATAWARRQVDPPDVVIGTCVHPWAVQAAQRIARARGAAFYYEIADFWPESLVDLGAIGRSSPIFKYMFRIERKAFEGADGVIGFAAMTPDYVREHHGIELKRFLYASNGVALRDVNKVVPAGVESGRIAWAGAFAQAHGLSSVIEAAEILQKEAPGEFRIDLYGDGPEREPMERGVKEKGLTNVVFCGWVPKPNMPDALASAEMCLCTTKSMPIHRYGIAINKLFDYLAAAKPIVFAVDAGNDPVAASGSGISVKAGDARAIADAIKAIHALRPHEREAMGRRGREFLMREHLFEEMAPRVERFLLGHGP